MKLIIDRFEGDIAICETEDGGNIDVARKLIPDDVHEGEVIEEINGVYTALPKETEARRQRIRNMLESLMKE